MTNRPVYLDWNATAPPHPAVLEEMARVERAAWANPSSVHRLGQRARAQIERAAGAVAALCGREARDVTLTSGGTEANNLALWQLHGRSQAVLVVGRIEHPSVLRMAEALAAGGVRLCWVEPGADGRLPPQAFAQALRGLAGNGSVMVSLQAVNHETGVIQPVAEVARLARDAGALLHVDAVQAVGKLAEAAWRAGDLISLSAHKLRGPKGIGALLARPGISLRPLLRGGAQQRGGRPGTVSPAAAAGFAIAAGHADGGSERYAALGALRDRLEEGLMGLASRSRAPRVVERNGAAPRAPHVLNVSVSGWRGAELCAALDLEGVAISSGAACSAGTGEPSAVISAMLGRQRAEGAIRMSMGETTTGHDVTAALAAFGRVLAR